MRKVAAASNLGCLPPDDFQVLDLRGTVHFVDCQRSATDDSPARIGWSRFDPTEINRRRKGIRSGLRQERDIAQTALAAIIYAWYTCYRMDFSHRVAHLDASPPLGHDKVRGTRHEGRSPRFVKGAVRSNGERRAFRRRSGG